MTNRRAEETPISPLADLEREFDFDVAREPRQWETANKPAATPHRKESGQTTKSLTVEGWRFLAHSYAIVNQWQLLALSYRSDIAVKVTDLPFYGRRWKAHDGLFEPGAEQTLRSFETARPDEPAEVTLRIAFPLNFLPSRSGLTAVFGTLESQIIPKDVLPDLQAYEKLQHGPPPPEVKAVTPSNWSAEGFYKAGFACEQVLIVPHGVDIGTFHPMPGLRTCVRSRIPVAEDAFVFFSAGAMSGNKGIDLLLQAFAHVSRRFPHARLVLKGMDALYRSKAMLLQNLQTVSAQDRQHVIDRLIYFGTSLSFRKMAMLYQAADAYVSPYRAEGFNIPVLEAAASGIPIICTGGGATDDFVTDEFARKIASRKTYVRRKDEDIARLEPDLEHLIVLMSSAIEDHSWRRQATEAGPRHVRSNYTWDRVVELLTGKLFN